MDESMTGHKNQLTEKVGIGEVMIVIFVPTEISSDHDDPS